VTEKPEVAKKSKLTLVLTGLMIMMALVAIISTAYLAFKIRLVILCLYRVIISFDKHHCTSLCFVTWPECFQLSCIGLLSYVYFLNELKNAWIWWSEDLYIISI